MPAHIDLRLGQYAQASEANVRAIEADRKHRARFPDRGFYQIYMAHNPHFLAFSSMMEGRSAAALDAARALVDNVPAAFVADRGPFIDGYLPIVLHVLVRFGRWDDVLSQPAFPEHLVISNAMRHYARGTAYAALGRVDEAQREKVELDAACEKVGEDATVGNNPARSVLAIAQKMLAGEIAFRRGQAESAEPDLPPALKSSWFDTAFSLLREAAAAEDALAYDEPPDWMMPVRHALGAALVQARRFEEAEQVYREDLRRFPDNGWSLFGLARALYARGAIEEGRDVRQRFDRAWSRADVELRSSCFCQPGL
jgi:tetratricopeptide (TPR) repeat protein